MNRRYVRDPVESSMYVREMAEFHTTFDLPIRYKPTLLDPKDFIRRLSLITSEVGELGDAVRRKDIVEIADALGDLLYVTFGMAMEMGLDIDRIFDDIHRSNMTKVWEDGTVHKDAGGKVLKPETYTPVDLKWLENVIRINEITDQLRNDGENNE
jgi:NTP pyrophosphatase (non-canonical NTP hydrolase)